MPPNRTGCPRIELVTTNDHADLAHGNALTQRPPAPFDIGIDSVGGTTTKEVWHRLHEHGPLIWLGQASRVRPDLDYFDWDGALSVTIRKSNYLDSTHTEAEDLATLVRLVAAGRLHAEIGRVDDWSGTGDAIAALLNREVRGNVVLTIG
jgi:NADPH:quinone reductase-like Zn-dependent oxidoreductase